MSTSVNKVILVGNLGTDVKSHKFSDGNMVVNFPVATSESYINRDTGEKVDVTDWHNITARNKLAELCEKFLKKGSKVYIEGKLKTRKFDDNGVTKHVTEVIADNVLFLSNLIGKPLENSMDLDD
ncbi:single-stranded DNA-binding protein [Apibacter muscae]|uniref:Single-stranded DNA-binding protein n=1 Tax=Apibacter muscae TaxID=2509004 RepID=A0A563D9X7_9FLAO|nr:single-stranded DNA-binding protein [Apibacter muscae]TWP26731.1 single-stranded DNA-binding protein [Apibacter muscae]